MSDLKDAEEIARIIVWGWADDEFINCASEKLVRLRKLFCSALKKARIDGLKEGAKIAEGSYYDAIIVGKNKDHPTKWPNTPQEIATAIRARIERIKHE